MKMIFKEMEDSFKDRFVKNGNVSWKKIVNVTTAKNDSKTSPRTRDVGGFSKTLIPPFDEFRSL